MDPEGSGKLFKRSLGFVGLAKIRIYKVDTHKNNPIFLRTHIIIKLLEVNKHTQARNPSKMNLAIDLIV